MLFNSDNFIIIMMYTTENLEMILYQLNDATIKIVTLEYKHNV